jgi:radical SAM enzyme (TIGR01210 family)
MPGCQSKTIRQEHPDHRRLGLSPPGGTIRSVRAPKPSYPAETAARSRWIRSHRGLRPTHDVLRPQGVLLEDERTAAGAIAATLTVLLTSRECPWRCLMCDLWQGTVPGDIPVGAIPAQLRAALGDPLARRNPTQIKLYNAGSFFDPRAVPPADYEVIAGQLTGFDRVIVESHPTLVGRRTRDFRARLAAQATVRRVTPPVLEVAIGLETAHPEVLAKLNKRMTLDQFRRAAHLLRENGLALRAFILVQPPFLPATGAVEWACRSVDFAFDCGATAAVLIPTRTGNGALEVLAARGDFAPPRLATFEAALEAGLALRRGRVLGDLWDLQRFADCPACFVARAERLRQINLTQALLPRVACAVCGG